MSNTMDRMRFNLFRYAIAILLSCGLCIFSKMASTDFQWTLTVRMMTYMSVLHERQSNVSLSLKMMFKGMELVRFGLLLGQANEGSCFPNILQIRLREQRSAGKVSSLTRHRSIYRFGDKKTAEALVLSSLCKLSY